MITEKELGDLIRDAYNKQLLNRSIIVITQGNTKSEEYYNIDKGFAKYISHLLLDYDKLTHDEHRRLLEMIDSDDEENLKLAQLLIKEKGKTL